MWYAKGHVHVDGLAPYDRNSIADALGSPDLR